MISLKEVKNYKIIILISLLIIIIYFALRLPNLTIQPVFADEAIYIRWAQVMKAEPTLRFLPLSDGKTPLYMWVMMPTFKLFEDPLFAGRFLSVMSGFATLVGVFMLGWMVFNIRVGLLAALLYSIIPYTIFFDRMALVDSMLAAFSIWSLILAVWLLKKQRLDLSMILGFLLGGALLVKTPAMMIILALPLTIIGFDFKKKTRLDIIKLIGCWLVAVVIALGIYNALRLGPGFYQLSSRNADYVFSPTELIGRPLDPFLPHLGDIFEWSVKLINWPVFLLILIGIGLLFIQRYRLGLVLLVWIAVPFFLETAFLKTFTARYLLWCVAPLLIVAAYSFDQIMQKFKVSARISGLLLLVILSPTIYFVDYPLLTNPESVNLPKNERMGYFEDWTAGYGLKEIAEFLKQQAQQGTIVVGTEGSFGTLPDGLQIYIENYVHSMPKDKQIVVIGGSATISADLRNAAKEYKTYFVANNSRVKKELLGATLIKEYPKAKSSTGKQDAILLFEVHPE